MPEVVIDTVRSWWGGSHRAFLIEATEDDELIGELIATGAKWRRDADAWELRASYDGAFKLAALIRSWGLGPNREAMDALYDLTSGSATEGILWDDHLVDLTIEAMDAQWEQLRTAQSSKVHAQQLRYGLETLEGYIASDWRQWDPVELQSAALEDLELFRDALPFAATVDGQTGYGPLAVTRFDADAVEQLPAKRRDELLGEIAARQARMALDIAFDAIPNVTTLALSCFQRRRHRTRGHDYFACVLAVRAEKIVWDEILHDRVSAHDALSNFPLRLSVHHGELEEVPPFAPAGGSDEALDLNTIDPLGFERLIKALLAAMGYDATLTKASHDGGVDIVAVSSALVTGGKLVVQCKRYAGTIGAPPVRDLYGVMTHEGATKGILVTTSGFSNDARLFAQGKPLELIDGQQLRVLLAEHGLAR